VEKLTLGRNYLRYRLTAKTANDLHSPFVFQFFNNVINDQTPYYGFDLIESLRAKHLLDSKSIEVLDYGARSGKRKMKVSRIAAHSVKPKKYGQLLFRIANEFKCKNIIELGTSLGISTLYLSFPDSKSEVITLEGSPEIAALAKMNFDKLKRKNIKLIEGEFSVTLPKALHLLETIDLVYFDGNHRKEPTLSYFNQCLSHINENSIFIFDDIYWSKEMNEAWKTIQSHPAVTTTIDLFQLGIVFFRSGMAKQNFVIKF
jgi:predicted O-methyltransferase YrrM